MRPVLTLLALCARQVRQNNNLQSPALLAAHGVVVAGAYAVKPLLFGLDLVPYSGLFLRFHNYPYGTLFLCGRLASGVLSRLCPPCAPLGAESTLHYFDLVSQHTGVPPGLVDTSGL